MADVTVRQRCRKNSIVYEYRFEIASIDGKRRWQTQSGFKTAKEAKLAGKEAMQKYENFGGSVVRKDEMSYADFLDFWLETDCSADLNPVILNHYREQVNRILKPRLGTYRLKSITREVLQVFINEVYDEGYSYNTLTVFKGLLTKSFNFAVDNHYLPYSPAVRLKIPKNRIPKKRNSFRASYLYSKRINGQNI